MEGSLDMDIISSKLYLDDINTTFTGKISLSDNYLVLSLIHI